MRSRALTGPGPAWTDSWPVLDQDPAGCAGLFDFRIRRLTPYFDSFDGTRSTR
jgi:hypothetical protein